MTAASISSKTFRVLALLHALPRAPRKLSSSELRDKLASQGYTISKRTVERYLEQLAYSREFGATVLCDDSAQPYGWSIAAKASLSIPGMDAQMAAAWDLVHRYLTPLMPRDILDKLDPVFGEARRWLRSHRPADKRHWSDKVAYLPRGFLLKPALIPAGILNQVYDALYRNRQMDIWYKDAIEPQRVHPCALVDRGSVRYLVVRFWDYPNHRHLALHRLKKVKVLSEQARGVAGFNLEAYLGAGHMDLSHDRRIGLVLRFHGDAGRHLHETPVREDQSLTELENGDLLLRAELQQSEELKWWVLGFGSQVEVLEPASLRQAVRDEVVASARRYECDKNRRGAPSG